MDNITAALMNLGVGGIMAAAIVFIVWHHTTKTIPDLQREVFKSQEAFLATLAKHEVACSEEKDKVNDRWAGRYEKISDEIRALRERLK